MNHLILRFFLFGLGLGCFVLDLRAYNFSVSTLQGVSLSPTASLQFGPDHRLYVAQVNGQIKALTVQRVGPNNYHVTATESINLVRDIPNYNDDGTRNFSLTTRQVTGILVVGTAANPVLYVSSSDPRIGGGSGGENDLNLDTNSGVISRLTKSGSAWTKVDLVRGLPRSEENHSTNGMQLDPLTNILYVAQGGNTNAGGPSINFAYACETALSAAILSVDLNAIDALPMQTDAYGQKYLYNLPTVDDPNPSRAHNPDGTDVNDPFGGNDGLNQARLVSGGPVQIYSPGYRNPYDLVITRSPGREGRMYTFDNGANNGWGGYPAHEGSGGTVTNEYVAGEPGSVNNLDNLHLIPGPGYYAGHPNPIRANPAAAGWFHFDDAQPAGAQSVFSLNPTSDWPPVPVAMANPVEGDYRQPGVADGALLTYNASTNGIAEYIATNFSGEMQGNLLACTYDGKLLRIALNAAGTAVTNGVEPLASGFGALPLDVTTPDPGHGAGLVGTIWVCHYSPAKISVLEPADFDSPGSSTCTGINSFDVDEDGDGYSNADELANGIDPCSGSLRPSDADADHRSDLLDNDDDNDGVVDTQDPFPLDPVNGRSIALPVRLNLFNDVGIGFFSTGLTGVMMNRGQDYLPLVNLDNAIAGGTSGLFTIAQVGPGSARGSANAQKDAYQFAFNSDEFTTPYVVSARLAGPFFGNAPTGQQTQGIYLGSGDQDNYVSVALNANGGPGGIEVVYELGGTVVAQNIYALPEFSGLSTIDFLFHVDPVAATIQPGYRLTEEGAVVSLGAPVHVSGAVLAAVMGSQPLAVGFFANTGGGGAPTFSATWDYFDLAPLADSAVAKLTIDPSGTSMATSSTYTTGAFKIENLSTGGQQIQSVKIDLSTAIFRDAVFDPTGTAGDPVSKAFHPDSATGGVSGVSGSNTRPHNGTDSQDGYDELDITFAAFPTGGVFTFSIDVDPTTVKGAPQPGPGDSASVGGLELIGSTVEVFFSDGSVHRTRLGRVEASVDGSYGWLRADKPPKPGISIVGHASPLTTNQSESIRVAGPAGKNVSLVTVEGALYLSGVPNGGYDVDPYEFNTAIKVSELTGVIGPAGYIDFTVTPTKTNAEAGYNVISAVLSDDADVKGPASDAVLLVFDPNATGGDTQAPTTPGALASGTITSLSAALSWSASTDNIGVVGYDVLRNGSLITTVTGLNYTDIGLDPSSQYNYSVVARDSAGNGSAPATLAVTTAAGGVPILRINAGGPSYVDKAGNTWSADYGYNTGAAKLTDVAIDRTADDTLFKTERYDAATSPELVYSFSVPNGSYEVQLFFAEVYSGAYGAGKRVFDVTLEGQLALDNVDIFALAGAPASAVILAAQTTVADGQLNIGFIHGVQNPSIRAIKVLRLAEADTSPPSAPGNLNFSNVTTTSVSVNWAASTDNVGVTGYRVSRNGTVLGTVTSTTFADSALSPATSYTYAVEALDAAGNLSPSTSGSVTTTSSAPSAIRINAGGGAYTDSLGQVWSADTGYNTGTTRTVSNTISGTSSPALYRTERYDQAGGSELAYTLSVTNGAYIVRLHFAETYTGTYGVGLRVFDVDVQSQRAFEDVDIYAMAGGENRPLILETPTTVTNGQLQIRFLHQVQNPKINAIEVIPDSQPPTAPGALTFSNVGTASVTLGWAAATDNIGVVGYRVTRNSVEVGTTTALSYTDTGLSPATTYQYSVTALDAAANESPASEASIATLSSGPALPTIRVNAGGGAYTDSEGKIWSADSGYNTGTTRTVTNTIIGTSSQSLYRTERYDSSGGVELAYTFNVPNGAYVVRLHFAETYTGTYGVGLRIFDVDVQSQRTFEDVDIYALAGGENRPLVLEAPAMVNNGQLQIRFLHQVQNPKINAIEILPAP